MYIYDSDKKQKRNKIFVEIIAEKMYNNFSKTGNDSRNISRIKSMGNY